MHKTTGKKAKSGRAVFLSALAAGVFSSTGLCSPLTLTPAAAVSLSLRNNVSVKLSRARTGEEKAGVIKAGSLLLPDIEASVSQTRTFKENLSALGFSSGGADPGMIGPFDTFDARLKLAQNIFNSAVSEKKKSAVESHRMFSLLERLASQQVAAAALICYIESVRTKNAVISALAEEKLSAELYQLAKDKYEAGTATKIDLTRAESHLSQARLKTIGAKSAYEQSLLALKHVTGLPLGSEVELAGGITLPSWNFSPEESVKKALDSRLEIKAQQAKMESDSHLAKAGSAAALPVLTADAEAAVSGNDLNSRDRLVGQAGVALKLPLFQGGAIKSGKEQAEKRVEQDSVKLDDLGAQVEKDVRISCIKMKEAAERVNTSSDILELGKEELEMAKDRFSSGVGDNLELTAAQTALSGADDLYIDSVSKYDIQTVNMFMSVGLVDDLIREIK